MTEPQTPDRSVLGESWVIASTTSIKDKEPKVHEPASPTPQPNAGHKDRNKDRNTTTESTGSLSSSSWTLTGPELIMPSICEMPISEASWVAPMRSNDQPSMRKRRKVSPEGGSKQGQQSPRYLTPIKRKSPSLKDKLATLCPEWRNLIRMAINCFLIAGILHLLVFPELIQQSQDFFCQLPVVKSTYPGSCVRLIPRPLNPSSPIISPEDTIASAQTHLELIFTSTLDTLSPLAYILKESETMLADLQSQLQSTLPDVRNALDLEFQGSDQALRAAAWEFDSLRADLRSAIDSLLASPLMQESGAPSIARDTRLAAQFHRRAQYLDRLRAQLRSKADSLGTRFITLDDHLEAVDGIVTREERRAALAGHVNNEQRGLHSVLQSLSSYVFSGDLFRAQSDSTDSQTENPSVAPRPILALLRLAATHHRPVADSVLRLSQQLRDAQLARSGSTW
ncbi:hypothetical protein PENDEC_c001G05280 [Penicillium decumbens]|uniref:Uncharacterized protein n=1 Tax=Penicillium decumbens TaxID=69771 RepID=A0A1V6PNT9_PENDC|nr:hypothetical protein PENDEC_c001G05280 [Penicillium decumbens]